ncbi:MAG TPA: serine/threonine protein kinase [Candidatus Barnesiella merdigallinarum]|nr:serine/threonine protein kinase [Candidatus Barnesiella merdigallinarum]
MNSIAERGILFDGRYKLLRTLSSDGGTADVWLALDMNTIDEIYNDDDDTIISQEESGIKVAIKIYRPKNALDLGEQRFRDEFKIVFNCHHSNLVQPINFSIVDGIPYLVLPFCQNGSSEQLQGKITDKRELWRYIADVSAGLAYLHAFNPTIVHQDIKPANILIDDNNNYAITDFGISSHRGGLNREDKDTQSGTMAYMAPERFTEEYEATPESDIWSFGATLYELITGKVPFGELGGKEQLDKQLSLPPITQPIPGDIKKLISDCLALDPAKRPSAKEICRAAQLERYPVRSVGKYMIGGLVGLVIILGIVAFLFVSRRAPEHLTNEEVFAKALALVNTDDVASLSEGLNLMDSLGSLGYIPALYEQAFTYGWYSDSASVARKQLLHIELYPRGTDEEFLPQSHQINNKAIGLFTRIEEFNDPAYPSINANALYRLACYYVNPNKVFVKDVDRAEYLLLQAKIWAEQCNDTLLINRIERGLNMLEENKSKISKK